MYQANRSHASIMDANQSLIMQLSPFLAPKVEQGFSRIQLLSLRRGNKWIIPDASLLWIQRMGFGNEKLLERMIVDASTLSKEFVKKTEQAYMVTVAGMCLLPLPPLSLPFIMVSAMRQESLPKHLVNFQLSLKQYLAGDREILMIQQTTGIKIFSALDSATDISATKSPSCSIYMDVPQGLIEQGNLMLTMNDDIPIALAVNDQTESNNKCIR